MPLAARATSWWVSTVVQEDRHGVDAEGVLDAEQQLIQELLQPKLGERRVAQPGERLDLVCRGERPPPRAVRTVCPARGA